MSAWSAVPAESRDRTGVRACGSACGCTGTVLPRRLEIDLQAQLKLPSIVGGGVRQRLSRVTGMSGDGARQLRERKLPHHVVDALEVRPVQQIESFRGEFDVPAALG